MNGNKIKIIPLGQNCMPRTILTRWNIKQKKLIGEVTYPFDLAVFETREITHSIKTDFEEFFYNLNYRENGYWAKEPDCIEFVHDKWFKKNDKEKLIAKYEERIKNFRIAIESEEPILFIQILYDCSDIENLYNELKRLRGNKPFRLAVIDTQNKTEESNCINILKLEYPSEEYRLNWWKKEYYNRPEGKKFEKNIVDFCSKIIYELSL